MGAWAVRRMEQTRNKARLRFRCNGVCGKVHKAEFVGQRVCDECQKYIDRLGKHARQVSVTSSRLIRETTQSSSWLDEH